MCAILCTGAGDTWPLTITLHLSNYRLEGNSRKVILVIKLVTVLNHTEFINYQQMFEKNLNFTGLVTHKHEENVGVGVAVIQSAISKYQESVAQLQGLVARGSTVACRSSLGVETIP